MELIKVIVGFIVASIIGIIGFFLKKTMEEINVMKSEIRSNKDCAMLIKSELDILKNDYSNKVVIINEKIDELKKVVSELIVEIKTMNSRTNTK